jgi:hypothetical protein
MTKVCHWFFLDYIRQFMLIFFIFA